MNVAEFAARIKTKYPEYASMDDGDLARRIVAKYPEYRDVVRFSVADGAKQNLQAIASGSDIPANAAQPDANASTASEFMNTPSGKYLQWNADAVTGAAKGAGHTAFELGNLASDAIQKIPLVGDDYKQIAPNADQAFASSPSILQPTNTAQKIGYGGEQIAEFFIPGMAEGGVLAPVAQRLAKMGLLGDLVKGAATGGGVTAAQGGNPIVGAAGGAGGTLVGAGLQKLGSGALNALVGAKPSSFESGANPAKGMVDEGVWASTPLRLLKSIKDAQGSTQAKLGQYLSRFSMNTSDVETPVAKIFDDELGKLPTSSDEYRMLSEYKDKVLRAASSGPSGNAGKVTPQEVNGLRQYVDVLKDAATGSPSIGQNIPSVLQKVSRSLNDTMETAAPGSRRFNFAYGNLREAEKAYRAKINSDQARSVWDTLAALTGFRQLMNGNILGAARDVAGTFLAKAGMGSPLVVTPVGQGLARVSPPVVGKVASGVASQATQDDNQ